MLARLQGRPSLAVLCGNSEVEQQAAMWGAAREVWHPPLFHERLAALAREACPNVPYVPSSAHGGVFPHQGDAGPTSYYGVGAYLRDLGDARRSEVRFASECLAFGNVPEPRALAHFGVGRAPKVHDPAWKARTPRDLGAGWDYDDIRDHYVASLFRVDPVRLRYEDHDRYLALGRVATGEVMSAVFSEWRRRRSLTRGGLIWFLRDLWSGAGWGVIDASGNPKAAWYYLRRALAPVAMSLSDEGGNGIYVHIVNDRPTALSGDLEIDLFRAGEILVAPHAATEMNAAALFDGFLDLSYAYRFGPPSHDLIVGSVRDAHGTRVAQAFHFVRGLPSAEEPDVGLSAVAQLRDDGAYDLLVRTLRMAQSVHIDVEGFTADDNYFHLAPGGERLLLLRRDTGGEGSHATDAPRGSVQPLNAEARSKLSVTAREA
jgi:beta-mannosidase